MRAGRIETERASTRSISESVEYLKQFFLGNLCELLELISGLARENEISESTSLQISRRIFKTVLFRTVVGSG